MSAAEMLAGAAPGRTPDWHSIEWKKVWRTVRRLQARIVKAVAEGRWNKVKALVYLLTHSFSGRALAILRVVSNSGAKTPGVDGVLWNTPEVQVGRFQHPASARLSTATAPPGVHSQEQRQTARPRDSHHGRSSHASTPLARSRSHRGISSRRPFLWLSAGTPLCRCDGSDPYPVESSARSTNGFSKVTSKLALIKSAMNGS